MNLSLDTMNLNVTMHYKDLRNAMVTQRT